MSYRVILLDEEGCHICDNDVCNSLQSAKGIAKYLLSDEHAQLLESSHEDLGTHKVEVRNEQGECVWDEFYAGVGQ